jgi:hypothetical protein
LPELFSTRTCETLREVFKLPPCKTKRRANG